MEAQKLRKGIRSERRDHHKDAEWLKNVKKGLKQDKDQDKIFFSIYIIYTFSNKKFTVGRYLYIWMYLGSQSKIIYKIVDRTASCKKFRGALCKHFDWETFINKQKG